MRRLSVRLPADLAKVHSWPSRRLMTSSSLSRTVFWLCDPLRSLGQNIALWFLDMLLLKMGDEQWRCCKHFGNTLMTGKLQLVGLMIDERKIMMLLEPTSKHKYEAFQD